MLKTGILNPNINSLLGRVRHTNLLVLADRGFPSWRRMETVDISLVDDIPKVLEVFEAIKPNFVIGRIYMAEEFLQENDEATRDRLTAAVGDIPIVFMAHDDFKKIVHGAVGLIRTGDTIQYANMIIESA